MTILSGKLTNAYGRIGLMIGEIDRFKMLFKKYRLQAEIPTLSEFGRLLADKGFIYEDSIFSHWQKGTRIPQNRTVILKLLEIFFERKAINSLSQANEFLASANQGYLSEKELQKIPIKLSNPIFQVPNEISEFQGREKIIDKLINKENIEGKIILIHGAAGVGKTALAIKLGHMLKDRFKDGVLWYKVEEDNINDILLSIARIFGEDISNINNLQVRGTVVRSLLSGKNVLLFLDSGELYDNIHLLISNSRFCTTVITSQKSHLSTQIQCIDIKLDVFNNNETLSLFRGILKEKYQKNSTNDYLKIAKRVGNLPLAVHILARQLLHSKISVVRFPSLLNQENPIFQDLYYEDKNLYAAIATSYRKLDSITKSVLVSASIFKGKDFSLKSIGYINGLSISSTAKTLQNLVELSLIEHSIKNRYRIHPAIRDFVRDKLNYPRSSYLMLIATFIFAFFAVWWIFLQLFVDQDNIMYGLFAASYCLMPIYGGVCALHTSLKWGGLKSLIGKAILMFSLGLFMQVFGQLIYAYYSNLKHIQIPYPSLGDMGYFSTIPFYIYGVFLLAKSSGIKINIQSFKKKMIAIIVPIVMLCLAYLIFLQDYRFDFENPLKIFLDFAYPLGDAIYISIAIITFIFSRAILDGIMRSKALLVLVALVMQFIADYVFLYKSSTYYQGNYIDFIYLVAYFVMTFALLSLRSIHVKVY